MSSVDMFSLQGKNAVVIGGGGVLGGVIAQGFANAGANVAVLGRSQEKLDARVAELSAAGRKAIGERGADPGTAAGDESKRHPNRVSSTRPTSSIGW